MRTQSNKQVIEPIAHAVAQLVLLNSDAELRNAPIPDLRQVARVVEEQVGGLAQVGYQMMQSPEADDVLRKEMSAAAKQVSEAARCLVAAANALAEDPYSQSARSELSEAAKGLLAGTSGVLEAYDENEIRRIVENCRRARELISSMHNNLPTEQLVETVRGMCRLFVQLTKQCTARSKELLSRSLAERLLAAVRIVEHRTPLFVTACKSAALNPNNGAAIKCRNGFVENLEHTCKEIEQVVATRIMDEQDESGGSLAVASKEIDNLFLDVPYVIGSKNKENLAPILGGIRRRVSVVVTASKRLADTTDPDRKRHLLEISRSLQDNCDHVVQATNKAMEQPGSAACERDLSSALRKAQRAIKAATVANSRAVIRDVARGLAEITSHVAPGTQLARVYDAAVAGNRGKLDEALNFFSNAYKSVNEDTALALDISDADPGTRRLLRGKTAELTCLLPMLSSAAQAVVVNPNEQGAWAHFTAVVGAWEESATDLEKKLIVEEGAFGVRDLAAVAKDIVNAKTQDVAAALKSQDAASYEVAVAQLSAAVQRVNAIHRLQAVNTDDVEYRRQLEESANALTEGLRSLSRKFSRGQSFADAAQNANELISQKVADLTALTNRSPNDQQEVIEELAEQSRDIEKPPSFPQDGSGSEPENAAPPTKESALEADLANLKLPAAANVVIVDAEEPQPLPPEEAKANPIAAAAQNLKIVASKWSEEDNDIVSRANGISNKLALLAEQYKSTVAAAKKDLIEAGRSILTDIQETCSLTGQLVEACSDKRLKNNLVRAVERLPTLAQQLRIVCAVKASNPHNYEGEQQLVFCAQNLSAALQNAVQASESASIRVRPDAGPDVLALRFRRNVFRKRSTTAAAAAAAGLLPEEGFVAGRQSVFTSGAAVATPLKQQHSAEGQAKVPQPRVPGSYTVTTAGLRSPTQIAPERPIPSTSQAGRATEEQPRDRPPIPRHQAIVESL